LTAGKKGLARSGDFANLISSSADEFDVGIVLASNFSDDEFEV